MRPQQKNPLFLYLIFILVTLISGCQKSDDNIKTKIKGSFPALKGKPVILCEIDINKSLMLDTTNIDEDGSFSFRFRRQGPGFYLIKVDDKNYITLVLDEEKQVEVSSDVPDLRINYDVKGSPDSELYRDFEMFLETNRKKVDSLSKTYNDYQRSADFQTKKMELDRNYKEIFDCQRQYAISFLENHCGSLASLLVINRRFGERRVLTENEDFIYFALLDSCLSIKYPDNKHLVENKKRLVAARQEQGKIEMINKRLAIGQKVPDISLQDPSGKAVPLYSFEGKPVVLYFWASRDQQSRKANATMRELVEKSAKITPEVYAIAFESNKESWEDAISLDGIQKWANVTDYLNIYSPAKSLFNIPQELPYFILLDKGLIIRYKGNNFDTLASVINRLD